MRQAAAFEGGLMMVVGEVCELIGFNVSVKVPLRTLRTLISDIPLETDGVATKHLWNVGDEEERCLWVSRHAEGFTFVLSSVKGHLVLGTVSRSEATDLKELLFSRYTNPGGFDFPTEPRDVVELEGEPA